jgi:hypothetical protein
MDESTRSEFANRFRSRFSTFSALPMRSDKSFSACVKLLAYDATLTE